MAECDQKALCSLRVEKVLQEKFNIKQEYLTAYKNGVVAKVTRSTNIECIDSIERIKCKVALHDVFNRSKELID